ncbi:hypothetical protein OG601_47110 [Streptomyces sp. NBC_01239]|uniref:hypothetical protein n=1 Tax=Streptomyces sp. NBC_01239 TaxID=2903792 RepID=UPI00225332D7|nr:hypothetical protein [Streptomyces sp. NBC_01239]MCX4809037.1 hypothetical protein [Streptomyces sp. NBC_01239]MCX4818145.1 hypothetical protein [Streptomyces sp. NBC_01239]
MSLLHLPNIPTPPEAFRVEGCSCGGLDLHPKDCTIFSLPSGRIQDAIAAVSQRQRERAAALTRQRMRTVGGNWGDDVDEGGSE